MKKVIEGNQKTIEFNGFIYVIDSIYKSQYSSSAFALVHDEYGTNFIIDFDSEYKMNPIEISLSMVQ